MLFTDVSSTRAVKAFQRAGFWIVKEGIRKIVIPRHPRINPYTLKAIIRDAGLTDEEFKKLL